MPNFHICKVINDRAYYLQETTGHVRCAFVADIKLLMPVVCIVSMLPDIKPFWQACKYINDPSLMPNLGWQNNSVDKDED